MSKVTSIHKERRAKAEKGSRPVEVEGFTPCSQDMTICGDCEGNRKVMKCPRLREWLAKRRS
ncbi:MAG: hypothetical protein ACM32I_11790 [Nitrospirota bacterium]|jgi:hypothetical protein